MNDSQAHPYIPNSAHASAKAMMAALQIDSVEELLVGIPAHLRFDGLLDLPAPLVAEADLVAHVQSLIGRNKTTKEYTNYLGAGCYAHHVPAVCDEINGRAEFLTAFAGEAYEDHGKFQALFEYCSMMGELLEMEVVTVPTYDGFQASATALRVAGRVTGRRKVLVLGPVDPDKMSKIREYSRPALDVEMLERDGRRGPAFLREISARLDDTVAGIYVDVPNYFGVVEPELAAIGELAHARGAVFVVGCEPLSLGVLSPPASYGADIACGEIQSLGLHLQFGGGHGGFIATHDRPEFVMELPSRLLGLAPTAVKGEVGFTDIAYERTSLASREEGIEWVGTAAALWGITAGSYLALMGPQGMVEIGHAVLARTRYAIEVLDRIPGLRVPFKAECHFREFLVCIDAPGRTVKWLNQQLLGSGIFGGADLSVRYPNQGQCALFCVTETTSKADIDRLGMALEELLP